MLLSYDGSSLACCEFQSPPYHVTGACTFLIKVSCGSMPQLEHLILQFQKLGTTSTQIILSTPVNHGDLEALQL